MPTSDDEYPLHRQIEDAEYLVRIYEAMSRAMSEPARVMDVSPYNLPMLRGSGPPVARRSAITGSNARSNWVTSMAF